MRVMVSQPMKGLTEDQTRKNRAKVVAMLESEGHTVIDTVFSNSAPAGVNQSLWLLGKRFQAIASVDAVYFMDGWRETRGCRMEQNVCELYGIRAIFDGAVEKEIEGAEEKYLFPKAMIDALTCGSRIEPGSCTISCSCQEPGSCIEGCFEFYSDGAVLICTDFLTSSFAHQYFWEAKSENGGRECNPKQECFAPEDQRRYVNFGSKLFMQLRYKIASGEICSIMGVNMDFDKVTYSIDDTGRYHVSWKGAPVSELIAVAASLIA